MIKKVKIGRRTFYFKKDGSLAYLHFLNNKTEAECWIEFNGKEIIKQWKGKDKIVVDLEEVKSINPFKFN